MSRYNSTSKIATICYLMIAIQIIATIVTLIPNIDILLASNTGMIYSFFLTKLIQAGINLLLLYKQQKNPTLVKSILIVFVSIAIGIFDSSNHSWSVYYSFIDMFLIALSLVLLVMQIKFSRVREGF